MAETEVKKSAGTKLNAFLEKNRKAVLVSFLVIIIALIAFISISVISSKNAEKDIARIDEISFSMTNNSATLEQTELDTRATTALEALKPFLKKNGIAGVRANMLAAEIAFLQKDYESAINYWDATFAKGKKVYTAPLALYNKAVCLEQLGKTEEAAKLYKDAADCEGFVLASHALFNYARVLETLGNYTEAVAAYKEVSDKYPSDKWANLAKTRVIALQVENKAE